jgi:hypothetical protein
MQQKKIILVFILFFEALNSFAKLIVVLKSRLQPIISTIKTHTLTTKCEIAKISAHFVLQLDQRIVL